jgi:nanoRNase/pAp phosphatase (c-di-AMP/oligoRNAs hydrolase)
LATDQELKGFPYIDPGLVHKALVICHRNADADSYLSAFALSALMRGLSPGCEVQIATPGGVTTLTAKLKTKFPHPTLEEGGDETFDLYVAVDVGDEELLNEWKGKLAGARGVRVLVDHHPLRPGGPYDRVVVDESATSAAEVVFSIFRAKGVEPDAATAQALLEALLFDSSHLAIVSPGGLRAAVRLMDLGADLPSARKELRSEPDYGEVLAKLKGAQRIEIYKAGAWVVATSRVGSFQAHVARSLLYLGADFAIVAGESEGETRVSMRSTQRFMDATGLKLGTQVAEEMARRLGGHGGGHSTAASYSTKAEEGEALTATMKRAEELLGELKRID